MVHGSTRPGSREIPALSVGWRLIFCAVKEKRPDGSEYPISGNALQNSPHVPAERPDCYITLRKAQHLDCRHPASRSPASMPRRFLALLLTATLSQSFLLGAELLCVLQHGMRSPGVEASGDATTAHGAMRHGPAAAAKQHPSGAQVALGADGGSSSHSTPADCGDSGSHQQCAAMSHACGHVALPAAGGREGVPADVMAIASLIQSPRLSAALPPDDPPPRA